MSAEPQPVDGEENGTAILHEFEEELSPTISSNEETPTSVQLEQQTVLDNSEEEIRTFNIFVGDLKPEVVEDDLLQAFKPCGEIHNVHIFR